MLGFIITNLDHDHTSQYFIMNLYVYVCQYSMWFYRIIIQVFWTAKMGIRHPFRTPSDSSRNKFKDGSQLEVVDFSINVALKWSVYWPRWVPYLACIKQSLSDRLAVILPLVRLRSPVFTMCCSLNKRWFMLFCCVRCLTVATYSFRKSWKYVSYIWWFRFSDSHLVLQFIVIHPLTSS